MSILSTVARNPWYTLAAIAIGYFMTLLDMTITAVANPAMMSYFHASVSQTVWVTSAYLLTFSGLLLIAGRLGDRFGPKTMYLAGLAVFTIFSLACAEVGSITELIAIRAFQGIGAALMTPQTMAIITRIFPAERRIAAMGVWGSVSGLANLAGPLLGGVLIDKLGWQWIFLVNGPIGAVAFLLALRLVPKLSVHPQRLDISGVAFSLAGMTLLVFGIQQGSSWGWGATIWGFIIAGILVLAGFVWSQSSSSFTPLMPLALFRDRNFVLSNIGVAAVGAAGTAFMVPLYLYLEASRGISASSAAVVLAPMAIMIVALGPFAGKIAHRTHPRTAPSLGFVLFAITVLCYGQLMWHHASIAWFLLVSALVGIANVCIWPTLGATATRNLSVEYVGAGAGVYNTIRQTGSVLGSAAIAAVVANRVGDGAHSADSSEHANITVFGESMFVPGVILIVGLLAAIMFSSPSSGDPDVASEGDDAAVPASDTEAA